MVFTLLEDEFRKFIEEQNTLQEQSYAAKKKTVFNALPEFVSMIRDSDVLSSTSHSKSTYGTKGRFVNLVKNSKSRRDKKEEAERKEQEVKVMKTALKDRTRRSPRLLRKSKRTKTLQR